MIVFGTNTGWTSAYLLHLLSVESEIPMTSDESSWITIAGLIGCGFGAALISNLPDRIGRKASLLLLDPIILVSIICIAFVRNVWFLFATRFIIGMGEGAMFTVFPMYVGEIAENDIRDLMNSLTFFYVTSGVILINCLGPFCSIFTSSMICAAIPVLHFVLFVSMPESPYYYVKKNNFDEATKSLMKLKGKSDVTKDLEVIKEGIEKEGNASKSRFVDLIAIKSNRKASSVFFILILASRICGKTPIVMYTTIIFEESGSSINSSLSAVIYNTVEIIVMLVVVSFVIRSFGKKVLMIVSTIGVVLTTFLFALYFQLKYMHVEVVKNFTSSPLVLLIIYNISYSSGLTYGPYTYLSELFPTNIKAKATCLAEIVTIIIGAFVTKLFHFTFDYFGTLAVPFFFFAAATATCLVFIIKIAPELSGESLENIQDILNKPKKNIRIAPA